MLKLVKARYVGKYSQARNFKIEGGRTFIRGQIVEVDEKVLAELMKKSPDDWEFEEKSVDPKKSSSKKSD